MNTKTKSNKSKPPQIAQKSAGDQQTWIKLEQILNHSAGQAEDRNTIKTRSISSTHQSFSRELSEIWDYRELIENLAWRDLTTRYRQTTLGIGWALIQPLLTMIVAAACFGKVMHSTTYGAPYPIFVYSGLLIWQYFSAAVTRSSHSVLAIGSLIKKVYFPRLIAPIASVLPPLVDFAIASVLMLGLVCFYHICLGPQLLMAPVFVMLASVLALGIGFWTAALHVKYRDIYHIIPFALQLGMFATPVFYSMTALPEKMQPLYQFNPLSGIVDGFRWSLLGTAPPSLTSMEVSFTVSLFLLITGITYFRLREDEFADYV